MTNKKVGILFLALPVVMIGIAEALRMVTKVVATSSGELSVSSQTLGTSVGMIIAAFLELLGVLAILPALIVGIIYLTKKEDAGVSTSVSSRSTLKRGDVSMDTWSWGAFFGGPIWALGNKLYIPGIIFLLLWWIPLVNLIGHFYLGIKGRQLAWEKGWSSVDEFNKRQKLMASIIGALYVAGAAIWTVRFTMLLRSTVANIPTTAVSEKAEVTSNVVSEPTVVPQEVKETPSKKSIVTNTNEGDSFLFESSEFNYDNLTGTYKNKNQTLILSRDSKFEIELPDDTKSGDWSFTAGSEVLNITSMGVASSNYFEQNYKPEKVGDTIYLKPVESISDKSLWLAKIK